MKNKLVLLFLVFIGSILAKPRVSIITSVFKGDDFIEGFLHNMVQQTIFPECELILINANSPHNEEPCIKKYMEQYPNIVYIKLDHDPGLYAVWNMGIKLAKADLVGNANLDDRRAPDSLEKQVLLLEQNPTIDLAYCDLLMSACPCDEITPTTLIYHVPVEEFAPHKIQACLPGPQPVWRKSMHERCGYFKEEFFSSADWEMWCRAVSKGCLFKKVSGIFSGVYYFNPTGISTDQNSEKVKRRCAEDQFVRDTYSYLWSDSSKS